MSDSAEWEHCTSSIRVYIALNETLDPKAFERFLAAWFRRVCAAELAPGSERQIKVPGTRYEGWSRVMLALGDDGRLWLLHVRAAHPDPPERFEDVGRPGNAPLCPKPAPSARGWPHRFPFAIPFDPPPE